jgi:prevent-host-death family protein
MWSIVDAKSQLSEILRRARAGQPQVIGTQKPCVIVSVEDYEANFTDHDGAWLLKHAAQIGTEINLPPRSTDRADAVFE